MEYQTTLAQNLRRGILGNRTLREPEDRREFPAATRPPHLPIATGGPWP